MRYIIELNGEEPTVTIEEILDRELGRNCKCSYADYDGENLDKLADKHFPIKEEGLLKLFYKQGFKDGYIAAKGGVSD